MHKSRETFSHYFARDRASIKFLVRCSFIPRPADSSVSHRIKCNDPSQMRSRCAGMKLELQTTFPRYKIEDQKNEWHATKQT